MPAQYTNAVWELCRIMDPARLRARCRRDKVALSLSALAKRYELSLARFLNHSSRVELQDWAALLRIKADDVGALRFELWGWGAAWERMELGYDVGPRIQPAPVLKKSRLVMAKAAKQKARRAALPVARKAKGPPGPEVGPRPIPEPKEEPFFWGDPQDEDELMARADALIGVRLGSRGRDKGFFGQRISALLGIARSNAPEPDWRGRVEVKSMAVVRASGGRWRIKDGPALSMKSVDAEKKLKRVLWIVRIDEEEVPGSPVLCWYFHELDGAMTDAFQESRHLRPKGGKGATTKGWYLKPDFFEASGLMRALNGA